MVKDVSKSGPRAVADDLQEDFNHQLTLFHYWRSSCSWRLRWALFHKNLDFESRVVNLLENEQNSGEYLKLCPSGQVPCLLVDGQPLSDSLAIIEWLEERAPENPLLPKGPLERQKARQLSYHIASGIQPIQNLKVLKHVSDEQVERLKWGKYWIEKGFESLEPQLLWYSSEGPYALGESVSLVDLCLIPQVYNARRFGVDMSKFPRITSIDKSCYELEACTKALPEKWN